MAKDSLYLKSLLTEQELKDFKKARAHDKVILPTLLKLLDKRLVESGPRGDLLDDPNYAIKRANLDGRFKELTWLKTFLGDSDNE